MPRAFFRPLHMGRIKIHFIHPSPKTSKHMHNNNGASSFFLRRGVQCPETFSYHLPLFQDKWQRGGGLNRETQNLFLYNSFSPSTQILFLEQGIFYTRQTIEKLKTSLHLSLVATTSAERWTTPPSLLSSLSPPLSQKTSMKNSNKIRFFPQIKLAQNLHFLLQVLFKYYRILLHSPSAISTWEHRFPSAQRS